MHKSTREAFCGLLERLATFFISVHHLCMSFMHNVIIEPNGHRTESERYGALDNRVLSRPVAVKQLAGPSLPKTDGTV